MESKMTQSDQSIEAVLFDLDNTLIDRTLAFRRLFEHWYDTLTAPARPDDRQAFVTRMAVYGNEFVAVSEIYEDMLDVWPGSFPSLDSAVDTHFMKMPDMVGMDSRTQSMLKRFKEAGVPVGVVTNGGTVTQWGKLKKTGIADLVTACVVSEQFGIRKPDPRIFRHALERIGAAAESTLFVGDNPEDDILGAAGTGMGTAWISLGRSWEITSASPDHVLHAVWEVEDLVSVQTAPHTRD